MSLLTRTLAAAWLAGLTLTCAAPAPDRVPEQAPDPPPAETPLPSHYTQGAAGFDGIGKRYMGREISHVMGHLGADWLERPERVQEERTDLVVGAFGLQPDSVVADIGAGSGYFTFQVAAEVPQGKVYAVDIQPEMLAILEARKAAGGFDQVLPTRGELADPNLPEGQVDLAFMVDAYHEFSHPREMMEGIVRGLKPGGRVVLLEYRMEDPKVPIKRLHKMTEAQARKEMEAVGLRFVDNKDFLPWQHFLIFEKPRLAETAEGS